MNVCKMIFHSLGGQEHWLGLLPTSTACSCVIHPWLEGVLSIRKGRHATAIALVTGRKGITLSVSTLTTSLTFFIHSY